jgi:hypothetical protein
MEHPIGFGTRTVPPGGYVREHAHDRNEEVIYVVRGKGRAMVDGVEHRMSPGSAFFIGKNRRNVFINDGDEDLGWAWLIVPNGLEEFFRLIGRARSPGEPAPAPFPRPDSVLEHHGYPSRKSLREEQKFPVRYLHFPSVCSWFSRLSRSRERAGSHHSLQIPGEQGRLEETGSQPMRPPPVILVNALI